MCETNHSLVNKIIVNYIPVMREYMTNIQGVVCKSWWRFVNLIFLCENHQLKALYKCSLIRHNKFSFNTIFMSSWVFVNTGQTFDCLLFVFQNCNSQFFLWYMFILIDISWTHGNRIEISKWKMRNIVVLFEYFYYSKNICLGIWDLIDSFL